MNHHATEAQHLSMDAAPDPQVGLTERQITAARSTTEGTLAVAYELRNANLIALYRAAGAGGLDVDRTALGERILERLQSDLPETPPARMP